jgi:wyosine [tRNA(Phe)-imidazoG37] synthetase (radical SAM superfamily)
MLVERLNDGPSLIEETADLVARLRPDTAYLSIPTRPPAEVWGQPPGEDIVNRAYQIFSEKVRHVEYLIGYEGNTFTCTGDVEEDLLSITAVHPMREEAVRELLARAGAGWPVVDQLIAQDQLAETEYQGHKFYLRKFHSRQAK